MEVPATKSTNGAARDLKREHAELIAEYGRTAGAAKAQVARKIHETQVDMRLAGVNYEAWQKPAAYRSRFELSESQLRDQIAGLKSLLASDDVEAPTKDAAERRLERFTAQAERRGISLS
jgi:hypothetical protein